MKRLLVICVAVMLTAANSGANTIASSTMYFEGSLTDTGGGKYTGVLKMVNEVIAGIGDGKSGFDLFAKDGATAWFGDKTSAGESWTSLVISNHDPFPEPQWNPDTPDWYQYSLELSKDDSGFKWAVRNHPGATAEHPWYDGTHWGTPKPPMGVPVSGKMYWTKMYAQETDTGAYLPATGTPEIPGGAAGKGGGAQCWDMDWSWGSEVVPLEYPGFTVAVEDLGGGNYRVTLTPAPMPCISIKDGILMYSAGHYLQVPLMLGNDPYGYNYQAHKFNGSYFNAYAGGAGFPPYQGDTESYLAENPGAASHWAWPYRDVDLIMKWNEGWLGNKDCDGDGKLDRYFGYDSYIGSGAWLTNHMSGSYEIDINGKTKTAHWTYFVKIVSAPSDATLDSGVWYNADGVEIGPVIWGSFATIQQIENDPFAGIHGKQYGSPAAPGFGQYKPE